MITFRHNLWDDGGSNDIQPCQAWEAGGLIVIFADTICQRIIDESPRIAELDTRPKKTATADEPNVANPYVSQALLEEVIKELQRRV